MPIQMIATVATALAMTVGMAVRSAAGEPPNVVLIYVDDLGYHDVGFNGAPHYRTPQIDRLAGQGMVFTHAYSNGPNCAPSRACLMTGQLTPRHGIFTVGNSDRGPVEMRRLIPIVNQTTLAAAALTLGELFQAAGYKTAYLGKWHLGKPGATGPREQGFDINVAGNQTGTPAGGYFPPYKNPQLPDPKSINQGRREYLTERLTREAVDFIDASQSHPFLLVLAHYAVHTPVQARPAVTQKYLDVAQQHGINAKYAAMIESVDDSVGDILQALTTRDLDRNTMVIFYSDNGGHGKITDNSPFRGSKGMLYEGGIRVPLAIRWTGTVPANSRCDVPVSGVDFFETFRTMLSQPPPAGQPLDGADLMGLWTGQQSELQRSALYWHFPAYLQGKEYPGANDPHFRTRPCAAIRSGDWKLIEFYEDGRRELYKLNDDPGETTDVARLNPEITRRLTAELHAWQQQIEAPIPQQPNPEFRSE